MANSDNPQGGQYYTDQAGSNITGGLTPYYVPATDATALFQGDPVVIQGTSNTTTVSAIGVGSFVPGALSEVAKSGATGAVTGFISSVAPTSDDSPTYRAASTEAIILVNDHPESIFVIQGDSATASAATDVGGNADMIFTHAGNTFTGISGAELDVSSITTTATLQLKIVGFLNSTSNAIGETHSKYLVKINNHTQAPNTAGV